jgi:hypothetical protein
MGLRPLERCHGRLRFHPSEGAVPKVASLFDVGLHGIADQARDQPS